MDLDNGDDFLYKCDKIKQGRRLLPSLPGVRSFSGQHYCFTTRREMNPFPSVSDTK